MNIFSLSFRAEVFTMFPSGRLRLASKVDNLLEQLLEKAQVTTRIHLYFGITRENFKVELTEFDINYVNNRH